MLRRLSSLRYFLLLVAALVVVTLIGGFLVAEASYQKLLIRRQSVESGNVVLSAGALERRIGFIAEDLRFLARLPRLQEAIDNKDMATVERLTETFVAFVNAKTQYSKLRWIDESGQEQVRVDYDEQRKQPVVVVGSKLQDRSGDYFFQESNRREIGTIHVSPLDLNVENGSVQLPPEPTLRMATPLVDRHGHRRGIVILDQEGDDLVKRMIISAGDIEHMRARLTLVNREGYWLHAIRPDDAWGFALGRQDNTLARRHPEVWRRMMQSPEGQVLLADGLWTWKKVQPLAEIAGSLDASQAPNAVNDYFWFVVANLPSEALGALRRDAWRDLAWPLSVIFCVGLFGCLALTRYRGRVVSLEQSLRKRLNESEAANRQLAAQERFIRTMTDHLPSKVSYWDRELHCRYVNAAYAAWFGRSVEQILGMSLQESMGEEAFMRQQHAVQAVLAGKQQRFERKVSRANGDVSFLLTEFIPDIVDGVCEGFYALSTDITELKQAGMQLDELNHELTHRVVEVMAATRAKDDFLSNMSHEIRTPLNAILGLAYLLDNRELAPEAKDLVHKIRSAGRMLLGIISDILDYSKIEAGRLELEHVPFRLADVLDGVAAIMSTTAGEKDIELTVDSVPAGAECLYGDALRLGQVLNNLVSNAIKFTDRGAVSLHVAFVEDADATRPRLRFSVSDTGIGIPPDKQALIFEAFSQADTSTTRRFGGTGLGLSISRHLVHQMGGELAVNSEAGKGSEFWFTLPFEAAPDSYAAPAMALQRVLIVDDSVIARESLSAVVHSLGWHAETTDSGDQAIASWRTRAATGRPFDLLLIDWLMPGMDGLSVAAAIRASGTPGGAAPILAMVTAHTRDMMRQPMEKGVVDLVLTKPVTASMLFNAVAEAKRHNGHARLSSGLAGSKGTRLPGLRVMVVDDSEINCEVAARILEGEGAVVTTILDGASAINWLREHPKGVDLVLMDVQMPEMDGYETTRRIRSELGRSDLPVIALTAGAFSYHREAALAAGMNDFLSKPFEVNTMVATLQHWTGCQPEPEIPESLLPEAASPNSPGLPKLPGVNLARGLQAWGKDVNGYRKYLRRFADSYADTGRQIAELAKAGNHEAVFGLAHKLAGVAGNLGLPEIERLAHAIDVELHHGNPVQSLAGELQAAIDEVLAGLREWMDEGSGQALVEGSKVVDKAVAAGLLQRLLAALDRDSPRHVEPLLVELAVHLPIDKLTPIRDQVDAFDFRAAEALVRRLAAELEISLE